MTTPKPQFTVGDRVIRPGFVDCFGKIVPTCIGLTVTDVRLQECAYMPAYYRLTAEKPLG